MKILYATDIHAGFDKLGILCEYAKKSNPDLLVVSGDLADVAFNDAKLFERHSILTKIVWEYMIRSEPGLKRLTPYEATRALPIVAEKIYENPQSEDLEKIVEHYLNSLDFFEGNMDLQYDLVKTILEKQGLDYHLIPGNHDKDLQATVLKDRDMHKKTLEKNGLTLSFFGGANDIQYGDVVPFGTPAELTMPFNEYVNREGKLVSEIFNFLIKEKPDIAFTHIPPVNIRDLAVHPGIIHLGDEKVKHLFRQGGPALLGYVQRSGSQELTKFLKKGGSPGLLKYLQQGFTKVLCCGHIHESVGVEKIDANNGSVVIFNAGSLKQGYFGEISIDENKSLEKIALYRIKGKLILPGNLEETLDASNVNLIMQYFITPENELKKMKTDFEDPYEY